LWPQLPEPDKVIEVSGSPEKEEADSEGDILKFPGTKWINPRVSKLPYPKNYNTRSHSTSEEPFNRSVDLDQTLRFIERPTKS
jgi:hypothetical protein